MGDRRKSLTNYGLIKPFQQGHLSSLCGIYAAINAARIVAPDPPRSLDFWKLAYARAIAQLGTERKLKYALTTGLEIDTWKELQLTVYDAISSGVSGSFRMRPLVRRPNSITNYADGIRNAIDGNRAVLCALYGALDHYTVIAGYTQSRWLLHDSYGLRWIEMSATSIGRAGTARHWIPSASLIALYWAEKRR